MKHLLIILYFPILIAAQDHLLISEIMIPTSSETEKAFIEIYNPTSDDISMNDLFLANSNSYYEMVNETYSSNSAHFIVQFPEINLEPKETMVIALSGQGYNNHFGKTADFEIISTQEGTPDMIELKVGENPIFEFTRGMIILFSWGGTADLITDVDYLPWGIIPFASSLWMDKSGIEIDGPDEGTEQSNYEDDLTKSQQKAWIAPTGGLSLQRNGIGESAEIQTNGNGISGHNEATEDWKTSFVAESPTPGSFSENPGDGTGTATVDPDTVDASSMSDLKISIIGTSDFTLSKIQLTVPGDWSWSQSVTDVILSGAGLSNAGLDLENNVITIQQAEVTDQKLGEITIKSLTAPDQGGIYSFSVKTAIDDGTLTEIGSFPKVIVVSPLTIKEILDNFSEYNGKIVTIDAIVAVGAGITRTDHTDAYLQDQSGRGINAFYFDQLFPEFERGNRVKVTGEVSEYQSTTQIGDFTVEVISTGNNIPGVENVSTLKAGNTALEGTMIETAGVISDKAGGIGGGTNITINDGTGDVQLRIWDVSGVDLSAFNLGDTLGVRAVIDIYNNNAQLLVAYQEDVFPGVIPERADGSGIMTVSPDSVSKSQNVSLSFNFTGTTEDTINQLSLNIPTYWGWTSSPGDIGTTGVIGSAAIEVNNKRITFSGLAIQKDEMGGITISNLTTPNSDTVSVFLVKTAGIGGTLTDIKSSPLVTVGTGTNITTISIKEAREQQVESIVTVKGIVTLGLGTLRADRTDVYIQDDSGYGINVFDLFEIDPLMERGNLLIVKGELTEYEGKLEITEYTSTLLKTGVEVPEPQLITTNEGSTTLYEGSYIQIRGAITGRNSSGGGTSIYVDDGTGECTVRVWDTANLNLDNFQTNEFVIIKGVIGVYNNAGQVLLGYQEDISRPSFDGTPVFLKVGNRPFAPDKGEIMEIEFSAGAENSNVTLRIFDLGGRLVTTLIDGAGLPFVLKKEWDGRNHLSELVPLGTYICHLEVVNEDTGKRTEKVAPIVVGTVLK